MNKILVGMIVTAWLLISFLFVKNSGLQSKLQVAEQNVMALRDSSATEAIAYHTTLSQLKRENKALTDAVNASKRTKDILVQKVVVRDTATIYVPVCDTMRIRDFHLDTIVINDWRSMRIQISADSATLRLRDSISIPATMYQRVDTENRTVKEYRTWWGRRIWGPAFGRKVKVHKVTVTTDNPLIQFNQTNYFTLY